MIVLICNDMLEFMIKSGKIMNAIKVIAFPQNTWNMSFLWKGNQTHLRIYETEISVPKIILYRYFWIQLLLDLHFVRLIELYQRTHLQRFYRQFKFASMKLKCGELNVMGCCRCQIVVGDQSQPHLNSADGPPRLNHYNIIQAVRF